ncbi:hypothetical protein [Vibrio owensii]|uniref:hypothetical protein n=1 Tax=Vibrio harveyi group TaxID=717610 RepID=UPI003CC699A9
MEYAVGNNIDVIEKPSKKKYLLLVVLPVIMSTGVAYIILNKLVEPEAVTPMILVATLYVVLMLQLILYWYKKDCIAYYVRLERKAKRTSNSEGRATSSRTGATAKSSEQVSSLKAALDKSKDVRNSVTERKAAKLIKPS